MRFELTPNQPRTLDQVKATFAPGSDARWQGVAPQSDTQRVSTIRFIEMRLHVRDAAEGR